MNDPRTTVHTMGDQEKVSVPRQIIRIGEQIQELKSDHKDLSKDIDELEKQVSKLFLFFHILWIVGGVLGTLATIILSWLLGKI